MARLLGHRQTKGADQTSHTYCYRATFLLYRNPTAVEVRQESAKSSRIDAPAVADVIAHTGHLPWEGNYS